MFDAAGKAAVINLFWCIHLQPPYILPLPTNFSLHLAASGRWFPLCALMIVFAFSLSFSNIRSFPFNLAYSYLLKLHFNSCVPLSKASHASFLSGFSSLSWVLFFTLFFSIYCFFIYSPLTYHISKFLKAIPFACSCNKFSFSLLKRIWGWWLYKLRLTWIFHPKIGWRINSSFSEREKISILLSQKEGGINEIMLILSTIRVHGHNQFQGNLIKDDRSETPKSPEINPWGFGKVPILVPRCWTYLIIVSL